MDRFYLDNATLYQRMVNALKPPAVSKAAQVALGTTSPEMVVGARVRPLLGEDAAAGFPCAVFPRSHQDGVVDIHDLYNHPRGRPILKSSNYQVDKLFDAATTTEQIYDSLVANLVPFAWNGGIGTLFAYGQTGSGKTFTVSRLEQLVAETLTDGSLEGQRQVHFTIVELAGNSAFDLLNSRKPISILEDSFGVTQLAGAEEHHVQGRGEVMDLIERAASFRQTAPTLKNGSEGLLYLIDLAGSEAARDVAAHGADRMRETRDINMSLSVLKDCICGKVMADTLRLAGGPKSKLRKPHIPFRQSALTKVLKHVFDPADGQACRTVVIACVSPSLGDVGPSKNTLRYAEMLRVVIPKTDDKRPFPAPRITESATVANAGRASSRDLVLAGSEVPFKKRLCPGMAVRLFPAPDLYLELGLGHDDLKLAVVLCPIEALQDIDKNSLGNRLHQAEGKRSGTVDGSPGGAARYLCAVVTPSPVAEAYQLNLWRQIVVDVVAMEQEVFLEYDAETRYYYISA